MPAARQPSGEHGGAGRRDAAPIVHLLAVGDAAGYEVFPLACPHGGASMRLLAFVTDTASVTRMLRPLGAPTQPPRIAPARGPPQWEEACDPSPVYDPSQGEPDRGFEFDQTISG